MHFNDFTDINQLHVCVDKNNARKYENNTHWTETICIISQQIICNITDGFVQNAMNTRYV